MSASSGGTGKTRGVPSRRTITERPLPTVAPPFTVDVDEVAALKRQLEELESTLRPHRYKCLADRGAMSLTASIRNPQGAEDWRTLPSDRREIAEDQDRRQTR